MIRHTIDSLWLAAERTLWGWAGDTGNLLRRLIVKLGAVALSWWGAKISNYSTRFWDLGLKGVSGFGLKTSGPRIWGFRLGRG